MFPHDSFVIVLSAPSGAGKGTIGKMLMERDEKIKFSVSATTRSKREGEIDGKDYYFLTRDEFKDKVSQGEFLEFAEVFRNYYGTLRKPVEDMLAQGNEVIFDIDWQGGELISKNFDPRRTLKIFLLPPSLEEIRKRIKGRNRDTAEDIEYRLSKTFDEAIHFKEYDYIVINDDLEETYNQIKSIIVAKRIELAKKDIIETFINNNLK